LRIVVVVESKEWVEGWGLGVVVRNEERRVLGWGVRGRGWIWGVVVVVVAVDAVLLREAKDVEKDRLRRLVSV
jgi:hypothetical protein